MKYKSGSNSPTVNQPQASSLSGILTRLRQSVAQKTRIANLRLSLGLGAVCWCVSAAILPQIAQAYTARVNLALDRQSTETYETLLRRAEAASRAAVQRSFDQDILVTDVAVIIVAQNQGAIAPILSLQVSRPQWGRRPDAQSWTTYFPNAQLLLGLQEVATTTSGQVTTFPRSSNRIQRPYFQPRTTTPSTGSTVQPSNSIVVPGQSTNGTPVQSGIQSGNGTSVEPQTPTPGTGIAPIPATPAFVPPSVNPQQTPTSPVNSVPTNSAIPSPPSGSQVLPPITGGTTVNQSAPTNSGGSSFSTPTQNQITR